MGELMPGIPSLPGDETTWAAFTDQFETLKKGDKPISLTNWDDTDTQPAVAAGSALEIAGATYRFPSESAISDESGLIAGTVYVMIKTNDPDANSATAYFTNTAPEWRGDLTGWYDTSGAYRYTGHLMDWDGATAYTIKRVFTVHAEGGDAFTVGYDGSIDSGGNGTFNGELTSNGIKTDNSMIKMTLYTGNVSSGGLIKITPSYPLTNIISAIGYLENNAFLPGTSMNTSHYPYPLGVSGTEIYGFNLPSNTAYKVLCFHT